MSENDNEGHCNIIGRNNFRKFSQSWILFEKLSKIDRYVNFERPCIYIVINANLIVECSTVTA